MRLEAQCVDQVVVTLPDVTLLVHRCGLPSANLIDGAGLFEGLGAHAAGLVVSDPLPDVSDLLLVRLERSLGGSDELLLYLMWDQQS